MTEPILTLPEGEFTRLLPLFPDEPGAESGTAFREWLLRTVAAEVEARQTRMAIASTDEWIAAQVEETKGKFPTLWPEESS